MKGSGEHRTHEAAAGRPPRVFDCHAHAFPDKVAATAIPRLVDEALWFPIEAMHDGTLSGLVASMDRAGIDRAILCSVATRPPQTPKITEWSAAIASDRIVPFASIHPDCDDVEAEVCRVADAGLRGLKFHPQYMDCAADDPRTVRLARAAAAAGLAMVFHAGYDLAFEKDDRAGPREIRRLHEAVPGLRLMACHLGGWERWPEALDQVVGLPVYLETSMSLDRCRPALVERILERHDPARLLFGTDSPWDDQAKALREFLALDIGDDLKRRMLWENALGFLGEAAA